MTSNDTRTPRQWPRLVAALFATTVWACNSPTQAPTAPAPTPVPSVGTANRPPTVTVTFPGDSACTPRPDANQPCVLGVSAEATDPDGDTLQYSWSGCAAGTAARAECKVEQPGDVTATVNVTDGHDHTVSASAVGKGNAYQPPPPRPNSAPTVSIVFPGAQSCTPRPSSPCTVDVVAQASDPDDDPLRFSWSGCASGQGARATCTIAAPGPASVIVSVDDGQAHSATATGTVMGDGVNSPPQLQIGYFSRLPNSTTLEILGNVFDPDERFLCGAQFCQGISASGACGGAALRCSCLAGLEASVAPTSTTGVCTLEFSLKDSWGSVGTSRLTFDVATLRILEQVGVTFSPRGKR